MGMTVRPEDDDLRDALFLHSHPGWSWRDLQETPGVVVDYLRMLQAEIVKKESR